MTSKLGQYLSTAVSFGSGYGIGTFLFPSNTTSSLAVAGVVGVVGIKVAWDIMPKMIMLKNIRRVYRFIYNGFKLSFKHGNSSLHAT